MKKIMAIALAVALLLTMGLVSAIPVQAVKPVGNLASAQKVAWNLSAAVMPVPPYGSLDIAGSDTASKLIVNQPNGNTEVTITGAMNGLHPNTVYTVYLSNGYEKNIQGWSLVDDWELEFDYLGTIYPHDMTINTENPDGSFSGTGTNSDTWIVIGTVSGDTMSMTISYDSSSYEVTAIGTIAADGTMSGTWSNPSQSGAWSSISGEATWGYGGSLGWSQLFTSSIQPFPFTTDADGAGSWHINMRDADFREPGDYTLSVWINNGTILISDNFKVAVD